MNIITDKDIYNNVKDYLINEMALSADDIEVEVDKGKVTLMGIVDVLAEKQKAGEVVKKVPGVHAVDNSLTVAIDNLLQDKEITDMIIERLERYERLKGIGAHTSHGKVTLMGDCTCTAEIEKAIEIASSVQCVREVHSNIKIDERIDDATITNAIERAFSVSTEVNPRLVNTHTEGGQVTLTGRVGSDREKKAAYQIASEIKGVRKVTNKLSINDIGDQDMDIIH